MAIDDTAIRKCFIRIVRGLTYTLFGSLLIVWMFGSDLLGYNGSFAADSARAAFPFLVIVWLLLFPFFLLVGYSFEVILVFLGFDEREIKLR